ncbi:hypothetical protein ACTVZO_23130 [Streptomyces sp. IBSNAI002]|uniref:hypothetical protein n=1 Tax=Streptomyces sp. IBSNAI002 TaxID=3457500 RepID=UPI003FD02E2C
MPNRPRPADAVDCLRTELAAGRTASTTTAPTTRGAWQAFMRFGRKRFDTGLEPDSDGLLFQYGTYAFGGRQLFSVDLTRQFAVNDDDGEHDHYMQVHCELRYEPGPDLVALGRFDSWFFHDADEDLDEWFTAMEALLGPVLAQEPAEVDLYEEQA